MDSTRAAQDQRKSRSTRISSALKTVAQVFDQLFFPRECAHCSSLLTQSKQRLCAACLDLLDPRSASFGCVRCLKPLRELGEERTLEECACKEPCFVKGLLYLEPADGVLQSLIKSKALIEEKEMSRALGAYLLQIAMESQQPLPKKILCYGLTQEEKLIKRSLEQMLKLAPHWWDGLCSYQNHYIQEWSRKKLREECSGETVWIIGLKKNRKTTLSWKETVKSSQLKEVILFFVSCS